MLDLHSVNDFKTIRQHSGFPGSSRAVDFNSQNVFNLVAFPHDDNEPRFPESLPDQAINSATPARFHPFEAQRQLQTDNDMI